MSTPMCIQHTNIYVCVCHVYVCVHFFPRMYIYSSPLSEGRGVFSNTILATISGRNNHVCSKNCFGGYWTLLNSIEP